MHLRDYVMPHKNRKYQIHMVILASLKGMVNAVVANWKVLIEEVEKKLKSRTTGILLKSLDIL